MKKIYLLSVLLFTFIYSFSQNRGYEKSLELNLSPDINYSEVCFGAKFTNGYRFNKYIFLGGGIGITTYFRDNITRIDGVAKKYTESDGGEVSVSVPLFATIKTNFTKTKVSPFFRFDLGYHFGSSDIESVMTNGLFCSPNIGLDVNLGISRQRALFFQIGCDIQDRGNLLTWDLDYDGPRIRPEFAFGVRF